MIVVRPTDLCCPLIAHSITRIPSLCQLLLVNVVSNLDCMSSFISKRQDNIMLIKCQSTWFGVQNFRMGRMTIAHAQTNYHI